MKFVTIAIVAAALVVCAAALHPDHLAEDVYQSMWEDFKSTHEKEYTSAEEPFRVRNPPPPLYPPPSLSLTHTPPTHGGGKAKEIFFVPSASHMM